VCRCFLEKVPKRCNVAYIFNPKLTVEELLRSVCDEFRIPYPHPGGGLATIKDYVDALNAFLLRMHAAGHSNVLVIDEAQNLSAGVLEQLRLLTNLETNERKLLQIVLIGQPELRKMLARPKLEQLAQRVIARYHLEALSSREAVQYIRHRLGVAGLAAANPFERGALDRIHTLSRGVPRRINLLCDRAMLGAYALGQNRIDRAVVDKAAAEVFEPPERPPINGRAWRYAALTLGVLLAAGVGYIFTVDGDPLRGRAQRQAVAPPAAAVTAPSPQASKPVAAAAKDATPASTAAPAADKPAPADKPTSAETLKGAPSQDAAVRELASAWGAQLGDGEPCAVARQQGLRCFRSRAGLPLVKHLDRPAVITIDNGGTPGYATLRALGSDQATLSVGASRQVVRLETLAQSGNSSLSGRHRRATAIAPAPAPEATGSPRDWPRSTAAPRTAPRANR
jgi:general secretion pathway protein A